jgi:hypothetical protein
MSRAYFIVLLLRECGRLYDERGGARGTASRRLSPAMFRRPPRSGGFCGVRGQPFGQLARAAEADVVAAVHLVGLDAQSLAGVPARPLGREHAVVAAQQVLRRRVGHCFEGPRLFEHLRRFVPFSPLRFGRELGRDVVEEDVLVLALLVARVRPPVGKELAG